MRYSEMHQQIYDTTRRFVEERINPHCAQWERDGIWPAHTILKEMGGLGLLGIAKPEKAGGQGLDYSHQIAFAEALGHCKIGALPMAIGVQTDMATPALARFGSDYLIENYLKPAVAGDMVAAIAVSEPGAGSDVVAAKTRARRIGDEYVISGQKMWITNGTQADWACVLVNTGDGNDHKSKSLIVVPLDSAGVDRKTRIDKLGQRASDTAIIYFDDVRVPVRNLIGEEGHGFRYQMMQFQEERLFVSTTMITALDDVIDATLVWAQEREMFGGRLIDNQYVAYKLAEYRTEVESVRALIYQAVDGMQAGEDVTRLASMAKLKSGRAAREVCDGCLQFWGGQGFTWDNPVAQFYRDLRLQSIGGGADEVMLRILSKMHHPAIRTGGRK